MNSKNRSIAQFIRFAIVGLVSNGVLYVGYILLTQYGIGPKISMTILFALGVLQTFFFNKNWSFAYHQNDKASFIRYIVAYISAYFLNLIILMGFVDYLFWPHQLVQGLTILGLAVYLFILQKFWVFRFSDQNP